MAEQEGVLSVELRLVDNFTKAFSGVVTGATGQMKAMQTGMNSFTSGVGSAFDKVINLKNAMVGFAGVQAFKKIISESAELGDHLGDVSDKLGLTTKFIQELDYVAGTMGTSFDELSGSVIKLGKNAYDAGTNLSGGMAQAFNDIKVDVFDANKEFKTTEVLLPEVIQALHDLGEGNKQTALTMDILGKGGSAMLPIIKQGGEAFEKMKKQLSENGGLISDEAIQSAGKYKDSMHALSTTFNAVKLNTVAPILEKIATVVNEFVASGGVQKTVDAFKLLVDIGKAFGVVWAVTKVTGLITAFTTFTPVVSRMAVSMGSVAVTSNGASLGMVRLKTAMNALALNPLLIAVTALTGAFILLDNIQEKNARNGMNQFKKLSDENKEKAIEMIKVLDTLSNAHKNNTATMAYTTGAMGGLTSQQKEANQQYIENKKNIDDLTLKLEKETGIKYKSAEGSALVVKSMQEELRVSKALNAEKKKATDDQAINDKATQTADQIKASEELKKKKEAEHKSIVEMQMAFNENIHNIERENRAITYNGRIANINEDLRLAKENASLLITDKLAFENAIRTLDAEANIKKEEEFTKNIEAQNVIRTKLKADADADIEKKKQDTATEIALRKSVVDSYMNGVSSMIGNASKIANHFKSMHKLQKAMAIAEVIMNGARAVMQAWALPAPLPILAVPLAIGASVAELAAVNSAKFATGGFPQGRNANITVNEAGQESVLNARATNNMGYGGVNAMNSGQRINSQSTNEITYSPTIHITGGNVSKDMVMGALRQSRNEFAEFFESTRAKGYLQMA